MDVKQTSGNAFLLSVVYASPVLECRRLLWEQLEDFAENVALPLLYWVAAMLRGFGWRCNYPLNGLIPMCQTLRVGYAQ